MSSTEQCLAALLATDQKPLQQLGRPLEDKHSAAANGSSGGDFADNPAEKLYRSLAFVRPVSIELTCPSVRFQTESVFFFTLAMIHDQRMSQILRKRNYSRSATQRLQ